MNRTLWIVLAVAGGVVLGPPLAAQSGALAPRNRFVVELRPPSDGSPPETALDSLLGPSARVWYRYQEPFYGVAVTLADSARERLRRDPMVLRVEADEYLHNPQPGLAAAADDVDPDWNLAQVRATALPTDGAAGVTVYILDSGIRASHKEFGGRASLAADFMGDSNPGGDCNGHGTHVAGVIGGERRGIARGAQLVGVRVLDCDAFGTTSSVLAGLGWVKANVRRPAVVNLSLTFLRNRQSALLGEALGELVQMGIPVVVAAGNHRNDACEHAPGSDPNAVTVAATDQSNRQSGFSNFGRCVKILAPGAHIYSAWNRADDSYRTLHGTSQAAGLVSGAIALLMQKHPDLTPAQVLEMLFAAAHPGVANLRGSPDRRMVVP